MKEPGVLLGGGCRGFCCQECLRGELGMKQLECMFLGRELCSWRESMCSFGGRAQDQKGARLERTP